MCRSLPDSNIDVVIITNNVRADALKMVNALTVSTKYQEILQTVESENAISIECKQSYSGISVHLELMPECNTSFSSFIHYAKRVSAFKPLYMVFRHFLKQSNIPSDGNHNMLIYLLLIYYLQISLGWLPFCAITIRGKTESLGIGDLFLGVVDAVYRSQLLSLSTNQSGFSFLKYVRSVEPKLGIHLDVSSKNVQRILKVIARRRRNA